MNDDRVRAQILATPLDVEAVIKRVVHHGAGAQVVLVGTVRDHTPTNDGGSEGVTALKYEAYAEMATKVIANIVREVEGEFEGVRGAVDHRTGALSLGDRAVVVAASAPHRADAFAACSRIIDRLKEDAPIWKHETRSSGQVWVGLGP